jgi:hypothetical protein
MVVVNMVKNRVGFEVFTAVVLKSIFFWDMTPCSAPGSLRGGYSLEQMCISLSKGTCTMQSVKLLVLYPLKVQH